jgi:NDP-4-keto-2,6-dideoxyhexose 3-C-methyltransferase
MMPTESDRCRICSNRELVPILDLGEQALTGVFPRSAVERVTRGPPQLVKCHGDGRCGLVQLRHSYDCAEMYGENYGYRSSLNRAMVRHLGAKVGAFLARFPPVPGDIILDIGSNDGTLLSFFPEHLRLVGMDTTVATFREFYQPRIEVIANLFSASAFSARFGREKAKIITSIAIFYDLEDPIAFVRQIAEILHDDGVWHFEQSYFPTMLAQNGYDTVCHEHLEYYSLRQIEWMLSRCGLRLLDVQFNDINGGSFAVTAAKNGSRHASNIAGIAAVRAAEAAADLESLEPYRAFEQRVFAHRDLLLALLDRLAGEARASWATVRRRRAMSSCNSVASQRHNFRASPRSIHGNLGV